MKDKVHIVVKAVLALLMLFCLFDMSYGFYEFTRFAAFAGFGYLAYVEYGKDPRGDLMVLYIILALLFQPFIKLSLGREIWNCIDVVVAGFLAYNVYKSLKKDK